MVKCILCGGETTILQKVSKSLLKDLYLQQFNVDIGDLVSTDLNYYSCQACSLRFFTCKDGSIPTGDDSFYNALNHIEGYYASEKFEYEYTKNYVNDNMKVLEVGCGKAAFFDYLSLRARENYIGLEFSSGAIEQAKKRGIEIENISIEEFAKIHKQKFDIVCSFQVLEHVKNPFEFLKSQIECLREGGLLIVAVPSDEGIARYYINNVLNAPPHHISRYKDKTLHKIAEIFGLELIDIAHDRVLEKEKDWYKKLFLNGLKKKNDKILLEKIKQKRFLSKSLERWRRSIEKRWRKIFPIELPNDYNHTVVAVFKRK